MLTMQNLAPAMLLLLLKTAEAWPGASTATYSALDQALYAPPPPPVPVSAPEMTAALQKATPRFAPTRLRVGVAELPKLAQTDSTSFIGTSQWLGGVEATTAVLAEQDRVHFGQLSASGAAKSLGVAAALSLGGAPVGAPVTREASTAFGQLTVAGAAKLALAYNQEIGGAAVGAPVTYEASTAFGQLSVGGAASRWTPAFAGAAIGGAFVGAPAMREDATGFGQLTAGGASKMQQALPALGAERTTTTMMMDVPSPPPDVVSYAYIDG